MFELIWIYRALSHVCEAWPPSPYNYMDKMVADRTVDSQLSLCEWPAWDWGMAQHWISYYNHAQKLPQQRFDGKLCFETNGYI